MLFQRLKMKLSLNWLVVVLAVLVGLGLFATSLESLLDTPMITVAQLGPWYGSFLPFH